MDIIDTLKSIPEDARCLFCNHKRQSLVAHARLLKERPDVAPVMTCPNCRKETMCPVSFLPPPWK